MNTRTVDTRTITGYVFFDFVRRAVMAYVIVFVTAYPWAQLMALMYLNQAFAMFTLYYRIYTDRTE